MTETDRPSRAVAPLKPGDHVVVAGAGPAGLTAAYLLAKQAQVRITVLEADDMVGGLARTAQYKGFRFDIGGHRFFTKIQAVDDLWHEILGEDFLSVPRLSRIHYKGHFFDYPLKPLNALFGLGPVNAFLIVLSYLKWHFRPYAVEENFEQWVTNRFGRRLYEVFFKTYTEKVWGMPCVDIRAEWAAQRIQGLSLYRALLNATPLQKRGDVIKSLIHEFRYPRLGPGQMWETCRDRIVARGHRVLLRHRVERYETAHGRVKEVHASTPDGPVVLQADHVISTMPLRSLVRDIAPLAPARVRAAAEGLRYRDFIVVALIVKKEQLFPDNWIYVHTPGVQVGRIQNFKNWSAAMVPEAGTTCLGLEYFCFEGDALWTRGDAALVAQASAELEVLGLARRSDVVDGTVIRVPKAYPIYDAAREGHLATVRSFIDPIANLHTIGRNGMHQYNNQDHSMLAAMLSVANMQGASHDPWAANGDFDYHEEQRLDRARTDAARAAADVLGPSPAAGMVTRG